MATEIGSEEGAYLVGLARRAIVEYLTKRSKIAVPADAPERLAAKRGVFVTLNKCAGKGRELRGCIGFPYPTLPLSSAVIESAIEAATGDPRFPPVTLEEMSQIAIEVSVLTEPREITVSDKAKLPSLIALGSDGLIVERGHRRGLLLPQVPVEWGWDAEEFLCHCCLKAGLTPDMWLLDGTRVYKFQAEIFEEESPGGHVHRRQLREDRDET
ncbi:MAG: TIGR00296 family protein [Candidatus Bathyarchaeia archaeon]